MKAALFNIVIVWWRSARMGVMLAPIRRVPALHLFRYHLASFAANNLLKWVENPASAERDGPDEVAHACSTYDVEDLPPGAADSGASAYVNKERLGAEMLRQLWAARDSGSFATA